MIHYVLILAAGKGSRLTNSKIPKQFLELDNLPLIMHSAMAFKKADPKSELYIALPNGYKLEWRRLCKQYNFNVEHQIYTGGIRRFDTVFKGLKTIYKTMSSKEKSSNTNNIKSSSLISIHDAARPFINRDFILELINSATRNGSAVPVIKLKDSLREFAGIQEAQSLGRDRNNYISTQTPQVFNLDSIYKAYCQLMELEKSNINNPFFDDASVYDYLNNQQPINLINGREYNIKITTDLDYYLAQKIYNFLKKRDEKR
jgi:2-C-methyl-D-erythritol 4-phosphate cytidylyltransferase